MHAVAEEELSEVLKELLNALDVDELQAYLDEHGTISYRSVSAVLSELLSGDLHLNYESFLSFLSDVLLSDFKGILSAFSAISAILILCGILKQCKGSLLSDVTFQAVYFAAYLAILLLLFSMISGVAEKTISCVLSIRKQMDLCFPLLMTLMAASGGSVSVGIYRPAVAFLSNGLSSLVLHFVFPGATALLVMTVVGGLSQELKLKEMQGVLKSALKWVLGISLSVFTVFLSVQGIASAQYDGISFKAIKYAIGNSVPIVGGFLSGEWDLTVAGSILLKNSVGILGILLILMEIGTPIVLLFALDLLLNLSSSIASLICPDFCGVFHDLIGSLHYFLAGILCVSFFYFLTILLMICSCSVIF